MTHEHRTLTRTALARELGVGRTTLWEWERDGIIPGPSAMSGNRAWFDGPAILIARAVAEGRGHA